MDYEWSDQIWDDLHNETSRCCITKNLRIHELEKERINLIGELSRYKAAIIKIEVMLYGFKL